MTLAALIKKGGLKEIATANFAKAANPEQQEQGTLAGLATLALAESSKPEAVPEWKPASVVEFGRDEAEREAFEERAGIREFDSGLSRREAEIEARRQKVLSLLENNSRIRYALTSDTGAANHWRVHFPNREPLEIFCSPGGSQRQVLEDYPKAVAAEPIPDTPKHRQPLSPELESLIRQAALHFECSWDELELMLEAARNDPEGALTYYQQFATLPEPDPHAEARQRKVEVETLQ